MSARFGGLLFCLCALLPAARAAALADLIREAWTTREGLPHNSINAIAQTPDGYLWIATWEGLVRYNGVDFRVFDRDHVEGFPDNGIRSLRVARDGSLWVGMARGGLARRVGARWEFPAPARSLVTSLYEDRRGRIWMTTENDGVERIEPGGGRRRFGTAEGLPSSASYALAEDANGVVWVGTAAGLAAISGDQVLRPAADAGLPPGGVSALLVLDDGALLVATERGAFRWRDGRAQPVAAVPGEALFSLLADVDGQRWYGSVRNGLYRQRGDRVERLGVEHGLPNERIAVLFQDREGSVWVGSNGGLVRLHAAPFESLTRLQGLSDNFVRATLAVGSRQIWVGTSHGLSRIEDGEVLADMPDPLAGQSILSLAGGLGHDLWVGSYGQGLLRLRDDRIVERWTRDDGLLSNEVRAIAVMPGGDVWIGTALGLSHLVEGRLRNFGLAEGLPGYFISALLRASDGRVWVGTAGGAAVITGERIVPLDLSAMDDAEFVFGFHEDPGSRRIWISSDRGLIRHDPASGESRLVGRRQGLPVEKNFHIVVDRTGAFWLTSNRGVTRIDPGSADAVADGRAGRVGARLFGTADGMASAQCNGGSGPPATLGQDGSIWIATAMGVSRVHPDRLDVAPGDPPPVVVESLRVDGNPLSPDQAGRLPVGTRRIEFGYAGLSFLTHGGLRYRTRLEGFDPDWVERRGAMVAEYTNLPPGQYRFLVAAANPGGGWSNPPAALAIEVPARLWARPLFWLAIALLLGCAGLFALRLRLLRARQREDELRVLVAEQTAVLRERAERLSELDRERTQLVERLREQATAFERQAREDQLTGLLNRRGFDEHLVRVLAQAGRSGTPTSLAMLDIDHFKRINDEHSHAAGDEVLRAIANALRASLRASCVLARWGGEEFVVLLPDTGIEEAAAVCERMRRAVEAIDAGAIVPGLRPVTLSAGCAGYRADEGVERWVQRADQALYRAKAEGRNRVHADPG